MRVEGDIAQIGNLEEKNVGSSQAVSFSCTFALRHLQFPHSISQQRLLEVFAFFQSVLFPSRQLPSQACSSWPTCEEGA